MLRLHTESGLQQVNDTQFIEVVFCMTSIGATDRIWFAAGERYPIYRGSFCMTSIGATDRIWFGKSEQYPIYGLMYLCIPLSGLHQHIYFRKDFQRCTLTVGC